MTTKLKALCSHFRQALEMLGRKTDLATLQEFPRGACGDASLLLSRWLGELGYSDIQYVCGIRKGHSHAWLEVGNLIVDITADQFADASDAVFISRSRRWHRTFSESQRHEAIFEVYDAGTQQQLLSAYRIIRRHPTIASTVRRTRCTTAACAPVAPRVPVRFAAGEA